MILKEKPQYYDLTGISTSPNSSKLALERALERAFSMKALPYPKSKLASC